ncbi:MAG: GAF domain-containing sensor histidine kinase, partial [Cyanobacteriota bacterium]|nr:GAF domain-containing sensor histidine kinase [Cyanobacteriota bacterium]
PYDKKLICADGRQIKVKVSCTYLEEELKSSNKTYKYIVRVSECNQNEQNSGFGQHWLENLLNILPAPFLLIEPETAKVTFANKAANKMAGGQFPLAQSQEEYSKFYRFTDAEGKLIPNELTPPIRVALGEKLEGVEINWHERDNTYQIKVFADTLPATDSYPATCVALFQDISKLKQLEESSRLENERLELLFDTNSYLISSKQPEELIEILYDDIAEKLGLDCYLYYLADRNSQEIKLASYSGITFSQAKDLELQKFGQGIFGTVASKLRAVNLENVQQSKDLDTEPIRSNGILAYYCCPLIFQGQLLGTISFGSRTSSGFNNREIGIMQAVCNQITIAIQQANLMNSLQKANCIKDEFLAILSHELRSPLNSILGWSQYLQVRKLDESTTSRALESIERNARELHNTIEELLDMSRTIQGQMQLNIRNCNLTSIIVTVIENLRSASLAKQIEIKLLLHKGLEMNERIQNTEFADTFESLKHLSSLATISGSHDAILKNRNFVVAGDSQRLSQVMWNLLSNAIKFTASGGCVEVRLSEEKTKDNSSNSSSYAVIQVSDTGMGINSEFIPYVFDRFRQGDSSSTRAHNGLGLGLSIVRHIVELHGGSVCVESPGVGEGSTFTVKLPLVTTTQSQSIKKKSCEKFVVRK